MTLPTDPCTFAPVGDSISDWEYPGIFVWVESAENPHLVLSGGWAESGAHLDDMAANVEPYDADVLAIMGGTNDVRDSGGANMAPLLDEIDTIIEEAEVETVLIAAIPPSNPYTTWANAWNALLAGYAGTNGHTFYDPWEAWRTVSGTWVAGRCKPDGIHPQDQTAKFAGHRMARKIGLVQAEAQSARIPVWLQDPFAWIGIGEVV